MHFNYCSVLGWLNIWEEPASAPDPLGDETTGEQKALRSFGDAPPAARRQRPWSWPLQRPVKPSDYLSDLDRCDSSHSKPWRLHHTFKMAPQHPLYLDQEGAKWVLNGLHRLSRPSATPTFNTVAKVVIRWGFWTLKPQTGTHQSCPSLCTSRGS